MPSAEELKTRIESALPGATASVEDLTGGGDHFRAEVVSGHFEGLSRIEQHQLVYGIFGNEVAARYTLFPSRLRHRGAPDDQPGDSRLSPERDRREPRDAV